LLFAPGPVYDLFVSVIAQNVHIIDKVDFDALLERTSRTFARAVPLLPDPLRRQVGLAYLLFRTADTLEDAARWPVGWRVSALNELARGPHAPGVAHRLSREWTAVPPVMHAGYLELLEAFPDLTAALGRLGGRAQEVIWAHARRTISGMTTFLGRADAGGTLRLRDVTELRAYCYAVAGIVGELLAELFVLHEPRLRQAHAALCRLAPTFGEGLQLVNILKDAGADAAERRFFLPPDMDRPAVTELARTEMAAARRYVDLLRANAAPSGVVGSCALHVLLTDAALTAIERNGPGSKVHRSTVARIGDHLLRALAGNRALWHLPEDLA